MDRPAILIVDDERHLIESLSLMLEDEYRILTAGDGFEALSIIDRHRPSLILLDLKMCGMGGLELLERVREGDKDLPVFIMTGNSCRESARRCADLNVQAYLEKPVDIEELIKRINAVFIEDLESPDSLHAVWGRGRKDRTNSVSTAAKEAIKYIYKKLEGFRKIKIQK